MLPLIEGKGEWIPDALPESRNCDGRPVWEPPELDYSKWIDNEHEQKREAVLKYIGNNIAKTTDFKDLRTGVEVLREYRGWVDENVDTALEADDD